jgi:glycosyl-4,4'-diaponeurosporenoate acyltransferase
MRCFYFSTSSTIALDIFAWLIIHMSVSYAVTQMPGRLFNPSLWLFRSRRRDIEEKIFERFLFVRSWKKLLPDGAAFFAKGFPKEHLSARNPEYISRFILETCRGECAHWVTALFAPLFFFWNDARVGWIMILYAFLANFPCIITQRYNRFRLQRLFPQRTVDPA